MRSLYGVETLLIVAAGMSLAGGFMQAADAKSNAAAEAAYLEAEANQARKQGARDKEDLAKEERRLQARARAVLAAGGADTTDGSGLAILTGNAAEYGIKNARLDDDVNSAVSSLEARAANTRRAGDRAATLAIFGGAANAVGLYAKSQTLRPPTAPRTSSGGSGGGSSGRVGGGV